CVSSVIYGSANGQYLYNRPCTFAGEHTCNPSYPTNAGCVFPYVCFDSAIYDSTSTTSTTALASGQYLYNTPCTMVCDYTCNPDYPTNAGCAFPYFCADTTVYAY